jgi:SAM-dependent methyltransferase
MGTSTFDQKTTATIRPTSTLYPSSNRPGERMLLAPLRRRLFSRAIGEVLDIACGDGVNFAHIPAACEITAGDLSAPQVSAARATGSALGRAIDYLIFDAEALPFPDHSFDTVISSMALCSYRDPVQALREMARVTRADGRILLLEHGRSSFPPLAAWQDAIERRRGNHDGCHQNREPLQLAREAGLEVVEARRHWLGVGHSIEARPGSATS